MPDVGVSLRMTQFVAPFGILKNVVTARKIQTCSTHKLTLKSARRNNSWNHVKEKFEYFIFLYGKYMEKWICDILQVWIVEQTEIFSSTEFWICNVGAQLKVKATVSRDVLRKFLLTEKCCHLFSQKRLTTLPFKKNELCLRVSLEFHIFVLVASSEEKTTNIDLQKTNQRNKKFQRKLFA